MRFPQFLILFLTFFNEALIAALNGGKAKLAPGGIKTGKSRARLNLWLANQGSIRYILNVSEWLLLEQASIQCLHVLWLEQKIKDLLASCINWNLRSKDFSANWIFSQEKLLLAKTWKVSEFENVSFWKRLTSSLFDKQILINFFICLISSKEVLVFEDTAFI